MCLFVGCEKGGDGSGGSPVNFVGDVKPILETHCVRCHNDEHLFGDLNLTNHSSAMQGSKAGPILVPGEPEKSLLYQATDPDHGKNAKSMPATGPSLSDQERETIRRWIEQGGDWPEGEEGAIRPVKPNADQV